MRIAMLGTRGVPARYGGFETAVEEIGARLVEMGHEVVVFCRPVEGEEPGTTYKGMTLIQLPVVRKRALETLAHTALSVVHRALRGVDVALVFNAANSPLLPVLRMRRIPVVTHVDGLEWKRSKWGPIGRRYYRVAESLAVRWSDEIIADAQGIADYYRAEFSSPSRLIAYGAPYLSDPGSHRLAELDLSPHSYHLVVARFEPENHVLQIVQGYAASSSRFPLVVVGSAPYADEYTAAIRAASDDRVRLLGGIWDQEQLDQLYANATSYLHGHSVGGTNPSLLRAVGAGAPVIAFDTVFNREVVGADGLFFTDPGSVTEQLRYAEKHPDDLQARGARLKEASRRYNWDDVASRYEALCRDQLSGGARRKRPSGRRNRRGWHPEGPVRGTVLIAHPGAELYGSDRVLLESVSALVEAGERVVLAVPENGPLVAEAERRGGEVRICPTPILRRSALSPVGAIGLLIETLRALGPSRRLLRESGASTVVVNTVTVPLWVLVAKLARVRVICHVHEAETNQSRSVRKLLYASLLLADRLVTNSSYCLEAVAGTWPRLRGRTAVVYNGVPGPAEPAAAPREHLAGAVRLLFIGRISPRKGTDIAISALAELLDRGVDAQLDLLGAVFEGYEWFERRLHEQVTSLGLDDKVNFLGFRPDVWEAFAQADIVVVPSTAEESFGNTAVESMLAQRPLVVSRTSGLEEAAAGFEAVRFVPPGDPGAIADSVVDLIENWQSVREQVIDDRHRADETYAPERYRQRFADTLALGRTANGR